MKRPSTEAEVARRVRDTLMWAAHEAGASYASIGRAHGIGGGTVKMRIAGVENRLAFAARNTRRT